MQMRANTLVLQVREEHRVGIIQHADSLVHLADGMKQINTSFLTHMPLSIVPLIQRCKILVSAYRLVELPTSIYVGYGKFPARHFHI